MSLPLAAAASSDAAIAFVELGAVALALATLARLAARLGITAIPLYLLAGLAVGEGGIVPLDVSSDFIARTADIGILLLLLVLGLEYSSDELRTGLRGGAVPGLTDAVANFTPGLLAGLVLGWDPVAAVLLGGVTWISSSGVVSKVLSDLGRLGFRETPSVLNLLVIEDLAMAIYLPIAAALVTGRSVTSTVGTVTVALLAVTVVLALVMRWGSHVSDLLAPAPDESLLLTVFGLTLLVAGLAEQLQVSAAIGAFLVGLALSGPVQARATVLISPLRDLFAAIFFLFFSFQIRPSSLVDVLVPAALLALVGVAGKLVSGWVAAAQMGAARPGRIRAGTVLVARGEFSVVIAALGAGLADGEKLGALAAAYVLITAIAGPLAARWSDHLARTGPRAGQQPRPARPPPLT